MIITNDNPCLRTKTYTTAAFFLLVIFGTIAYSTNLSRISPASNVAEELEYATQIPKAAHQKSQCLHICTRKLPSKTKRWIYKETIIQAQAMGSRECCLMTTNMTKYVYGCREEHPNMRPGRTVVYKNPTYSPYLHDMVQATIPKIKRILANEDATQDITRFLVFGMGLGGIPQLLLQILGDKKDDFIIDVIDIDQNMLDVAREWFCVGHEDSRVELRRIDAKEYVKIEELKGVYDVVYTDIFIEDLMPLWTRNSDWLGHIHKLLKPDGEALTNVLNANPKKQKELEASYLETSKNIFASTGFVENTRIWWGSKSIHTVPKSKPPNDDF